VADDTAHARLITMILLTNWYYTKLAKREIIFAVPNDAALLSTKHYTNCLMNIEDIASKSSVVFETVYSMTEKTQFLGSRFPR